jgi:hypothetical protein
MAHREFFDDIGRRWDVWEVYPTVIERRISGQYPATPPADIAERRRLGDVRLLVSEELQQGWLAFETDGEKRRLAPVPPDWLNRSDAELLRLLASAKLHPKS